MPTTPEVTAASAYAAGRRELRVRVVSDLGGLATLEPVWNALLQRGRSNTIFLTWEWVQTWWRVYGEGKRLHILVVEAENDGIVGLAPLMKVHSRMLGVWPLNKVRFIGDGGDVTPEYLDILAEPDFEHDVAEACVRHLCTDPTVDVIELRPLSPASANDARLPRLFSDHPGRTRCSEDAVCPVMPLPSTTAEFMATRSKNYRKKVGEYERRCSRELRVSLRMSQTPAELQSDMDALIALHNERWQGTSRAFQTARYCQFHQQLTRRLLEQQWLRLFALEQDGKAVALLYCFAYNNRFSFYQGGRDPKHTGYRLGLVLMHKVILEAIEEGAHSFDFLSGQEDYKYRWATTEVRSVRLRHSKVRLVSLVYVLSDLASSAGRVVRRLGVISPRRRPSLPDPLRSSV